MQLGAELQVLPEVTALHDEGATQRESDSALSPEKSDLYYYYYYYYYTRNCLLFAAKNLDRVNQQRWVKTSGPKRSRFCDAGVTASSCGCADRSSCDSRDQGWAPGTSGTCDQEHSPGQRFQMRAARIRHATPWAYLFGQLHFREGLTKRPIREASIHGAKRCGYRTRRRQPVRKIP